MYCYKLNNSYTVYVYFNAYKKTEKYGAVDAKTAGNGSSAKKKAYYKSLDKNRCNQPPKKAMRRPLPNGTRVNHNKFGTGTVIATDENGSMRVRFGDREIKLSYPMVMTGGILQRA